MKRYLLKFKLMNKGIFSQKELKGDEFDHKLILQRWNPDNFQWSGYYWVNREPCPLCIRYLQKDCVGCQLFEETEGCIEFFKSFGFYDEKNKRWGIKFFPDRVLLYKEYMPVLQRFWRYLRENEEEVTKIEEKESQT